MMDKLMMLIHYDISPRNCLFPRGLSVAVYSIESSSFGYISIVYQSLMVYKRLNLRHCTALTHSLLITPFDAPEKQAF